MINIPFLKKIQFPKLDLGFVFRSASFVGIDIGSESVKVVQLRRERERAVLETYGELKAERYFQKEAVATRAGLLAHLDQNFVDLLADVLREANVTTKRAVFSIPATSSFLTVVTFPSMDSKELASAVPFEAKKYIPIPIQEVALDWQILEADDVARRMMVLLAAVPHEVVAKYERIAAMLKLNLEAAEIESFSLVRSLLATDRGVTAIINWGALVTSITIVDQRQIRMNHNFGRGSREITLTLARSLGVNTERAEALKRSVGLSDKPEDREVAGVIAPVVDAVLIDFERIMMAYNRSAKRKIEKVVLSGGGASLAGLVSYVSKRLGLETILANPFTRTIFPPFLQPLIKEIGPNFAVAVGLALRQIASA